jgi:hemolysin activation/secretion protein
LVDEARQRWAAGLTHALRHNRTRLGGEPFSFVAGEPTGTTRIEAWRAFVDGAQRLGHAVLAARLTRVQGRSNLGPEPELPRVPASRYALWQLQAQGQLPLADDGVQLLLRAQAQRSRQPLVPLEQMAIGGRHTVRGYRENTRVRDNAQAFSVELHWPLRRADGAGLALTLIPFVDAGSAWNRGEPAQRLSSAGLGLQASWGGLDAELFVGHALDTRDTTARGNAQDHGIHFLLRWRPPL